LSEWPSEWGWIKEERRKTKKASEEQQLVGSLGFLMMPIRVIPVCCWPSWRLAVLCFGGLQRGAAVA